MSEEGVSNWVPQAAEAGGLAPTLRLFFFVFN